VFWICCLLLAGGQSANAQVNGQRPFVAPEPVELGFLETATGDLHLEIPLGSFPQRGINGQPVTLKLVYDSSEWQIGDGVWLHPDGQYTGWWLQSFDSFDSVWFTQTVVNSSCGNKWVNFEWTDSTGSQHYFPITTTTCPPAVSTGDAYAADSSGYHMYVNDYDLFTVYAPDGTKVYSEEPTSPDSQGHVPALEDSNGNYLSIQASGTTTMYDTTGRAVLQAVACSSTVTCYNVLNSQNSTSQYAATYSTIPVKTAFGESGVTECTSSCTMQVIQSIGLPDGTSYTFQYDCDSSTGNKACGSPAGQNAYYGELTEITLPTGGQISYSYTTFFDSYGNANRWVSSRSSAGGTWYYTPQVISSCGSGQVGCKEQLTVKKPSFDTTVYSFTLNNGVWPTQIQNYNSAGTLLSTVSNTWDFSGYSCPLYNCTGNAYIQKTGETLSVPTPSGTVTRQVTYSYDDQQMDNLTSMKEWNFYSGTAPSFPATPDRAKYIAYLYDYSANIINRPISITSCNNSGSDTTNCPGGGSRVAQSLIGYDAYALKSVTGASNHDDANFGTANTTRGNPTVISTWVSGSLYWGDILQYDMTGQVYQHTDTAGYSTGYTYTDKFFVDNGTSSLGTFSPIQFTNAYVTQITLPLTGALNFGYYYGSGKQAFASDQNGTTTYSHYMDSLDRATGTVYPIGWGLRTYTGATESDLYTAVGDISSSAGCSSCQHVETSLDSWGRQNSQQLVNYPGSAVNVNTYYDPNGRVEAVSHPFTGTAGVSESYAYDGLDRVSSNSHPDGQSTQAVYGAAVGSSGALSSQQGSPSKYGYGYPVLMFDEAGKQKEEWIDGFGRVIEVDLPGTQSSGTQATGSVTISGGEESKTTNPCMPKASCPITTYDSGTISITVDTYTVSTGYFKTSTISSLASALASELNVDSSPVTATASGGVISLTSKATGSASNYSLSASRVSNAGMGSFPVTPSGSTLTGGTGTSTSTFGTPLVTLYTYNALDELTSVVQGSQTRTYTYDGLGRRTSANIPEAGTTTVSYVTSGNPCSGVARNVCQKVDAKGITTSYSYDGLGRLTKKSYSNGTPTVTYYYDQGGSGAFALGRRTEMTDGSGSESYTYNKMGWMTRLQKVIGSSTYTIGYQYNASGELTQITYPSGRVVQQSYNLVGQLCVIAAQTSSTSCSSFSGPYASGYAYNPAWQVTGFTYGNGVAASFGYSPNRAQMTSLAYAEGTQTLFSLNYFYQHDSTNCVSGSAGNNGQIQCIADVVDTGRTASYSYDTLGRLTAAATNGSTNYPKWGLAWTYDQYNNRSAQSVTSGAAPASSLSFNAATNQPSGYTYDADGNLTVEPLAPPNDYGYDAENDLTSYQGGNGSAAYTYDGHGLRVQEVKQGTLSTVYIFSGTSDIAEYDNGAVAGAPSREYIYGGGQVLAQVSGGLTNYFHADHLSVRMITDASGNVAGQQGHFPFGEAWYAANTTTSWVFTSYERDPSESGLDYAQARFYDSRIGGFCSVDPLEGRPSDPLSWNRYSYVENDPVNQVDPSGQGLFAWIVRILTAIVSVISGILFPPSITIVPTIGGGIDLLTLLPGYNPHRAMTPPFLSASNTPSLSLWVGATSSANAAGQIGNGEGPTVYVDAALNVWARGLLGTRLSGLDQSHCAAVFGATIPGFSISSFRGGISSVNFYDGRPPSPDSGLSQNAVIGNGSGATLAQAVPRYQGISARTISGPSGTAVVLGPNFGPPNEFSSADVLYHEYIHAYTGWGDTEVARKFGIPGVSPLDTSPISAWLSRDCNSSR
jgi:RHS repeat-associated protein